MSTKSLVRQAWLQALERTATIARMPRRLLSTVVEEQAARQGTAPAILAEQHSLTYGELAQRMHRYARWTLAQGLDRGEVVCLLMPNQPDYLAIWLGITSVGGVVALLNTNLVGGSLSHCLEAVSAKHIIVSADLADRLAASLPGSPTRAMLWAHGSPGSGLRQIDHEIEAYSGAPLEKQEQRSVSVADLALLIYTSGTTGLPKAARVSHARVMQWSQWFAGLMGALPEDRMYNCLPLYHSVGGVQAPGAMLVAGGSVVVREKFSSTAFWPDIVRWDCTLLQYIGELWRYLLETKPCHEESAHRIRLACGNGLAAEVWERLEARFGIPRILEFYASTEGGVSLFNVEGELGSIGRLPSYLAHRNAPALLRLDSALGDPMRDEQGFCMRCEENEVGEAVGRIVEDAASGSRFEGYLDPEATEKKILRHVFEPGDGWCRTGDLMRKDERGFFYFMDRAGDSFRWKGENVATLEVAQTISAFPGVAHAAVYGVAVPGSDGRVGMAAIAASDKIDLPALREHLANRLPRYARPRFLRIRRTMELTGTFKYVKSACVEAGYDPALIADPLYFDDQASHSYVELDRDLYKSIQRGEIRL